MKIKFTLIVLLLVAFFTSCEDATNIVQQGEVNDQKIFTNVANLQLYLNETYDRASLETDIQVSSLLTDEVALASGLTSNDMQRFAVFPDDGNAYAIWQNHYTLINYANRVIRGATYFTPPASDVAAYNSILAQAKALRAFGHFELMVYFSTDISDPNAIGVPLMDHVGTILEQPARAKNADLYALIDADLAFADANLNDQTGTDAYKYVSANFLNAFRARMYLYRKNYVQADFYANKVITTSSLSLASSTLDLTNPALVSFPSNTSIIPSLAGSTTINVQPGTATNLAVQRALYQVDQWTSSLAPDYRKMWVDASQGEIIFALGRQNNRTNIGSLYNTNGSYLSGGPLYDMGRTLFDLYTQPLGGGAQDFRRWCFVDRSATISANPATATRTSEQIVIDKFPGKSGAHNANDIKVFRLSEMFFIKAECAVRANNLTTAASLIQSVRQARNYINGATVPTPTYGSAQAALADILLERRKELAFEGHRLIDLKRLGADAGVTGTDRYAQDAVNSSATNPVNINLGDYRFTLPIPTLERAANPIPQNPGY
jgi:hypothetical protein